MTRGNRKPEAGSRKPALCLCAALLASACADKPPGKLLARGPARGLAASRSGRAAAFLLDAAHPDDRTVPEDIFAGDLWLSRDGAPARRVGGGVASTDGAAAFDPRGEGLAFLAGFRFRAGAGELWVALPDAEPRRLAEDASAFAWSPAGGALAYLGAGRLHLVDAAGRSVAATPEGVQTFAWSPDGRRLATRGASGAGGRVHLLSAEGGAPVQVAAASSDFVFAPGGELAVLGPAQGKGGDRALTLVDARTQAQRPLGRASGFSFSPGGAALALLSTEKSPGEALGELSRLQLSLGAAPQPLGSKVSDWRWTPAGDLVYLARFELRSRTGTLFVLAPQPEAQPRELAAHVQSYSVLGRRLLWLQQRAQKGDFKVELWTLDLAAPAGSPQASPRKVDEGVYGYELSPDGATLYWKSRCSGLRSCTLLHQPSDGSGAPVLLAVNVAGFDLSRDGARMLLSQTHRGGAGTRAVDLLVVDARGPAPQPPPAPFALEAEPGALFLDDGGHRALVALAGSRAAVVEIDLP